MTMVHDSQMEMSNSNLIIILIEEKERKKEHASLS